MRQEFSKKTRAEAFLRANGRCEGCGCLLRPGRIHYDHDKPDAFGGKSVIENCRALCVECHARKTGEVDIPAIAKSNRRRARAAGIRKRRTITSWRRFDGTIVRAPRDR